MQPHTPANSRTDAKSKTWPTLMPIQPKGTRRPFFVVAAPDVNPLGYALLARNLSPDQPVLGLQPQYKKLTEGEYQETELVRCSSSDPGRCFGLSGRS